MASEHEIRPGARVIAEHGARLGQIESVDTDPNSGEVTAFTVTGGFWFLKKRKTISVDLVRQVNNNPDTVVVELSKKEFGALPERETTA